METIPLKKRKNASILWIHAKIFFHKNGSVKHIKCIHCGKTFSYNGGSTSNTLSHLYHNHFNHLMPFVESTKRPHYTYKLKCDIIKKLKDGIKKK